MDVKFLRTSIRHDVDHGTPSKVAKKRMRNAGVFRKYSGKDTPGECGPDEFLATQLRVYAAMRTFLERLA